jgi:hypothetical protein
VSTEPTPSFARLMFLLLERSVDTWQDERGVMRSKLTAEERGAQCYLWADEYPALAEQLRWQARQYGTLMYQGR